MKIDHMAVYVKDLEETKAFYEKYFDGKSNNLYHNPKTGLKTYFLSFGGGARFEIMNKPNIATIENGKEQMGYLHLAFGVKDKEAVDSLTNRLRNDGYTVFDGPRITGDGYYESCVLDPDGNRVEILVAV